MFGDDKSNPAAVRSRQLVHADVMAMARDLAGENASRMEKTLAMTASIAWFALRFSEQQYYLQNGKGPMMITHGDFHLRRIAHANRRFLATLRTLAIVRRLCAAGDNRVKGDPV